MTILSMPDKPGFRSVRFGLRTNTRTHTSPLTGKTQVQVLQGNVWFASYTLPPMRRETAAAWQAFLVQLQGPAGEFYAYDPDVRGSLVDLPALTWDTLDFSFDNDGVTFDQTHVAALGEPIVNGAGQTGSTLATAGWLPSETVLVPGDQISFDTPNGKRELHMVTGRVTSNAAGFATIPIAPPIRQSPEDGAPIEIDAPSCVMRLVSSDFAWDTDHARLYGITFDAVEAL